MNTKKATIFESNLSALEVKFNIESNENVRTTYLTQVNYSSDIERRFQRWYRYKEGFSVELIKDIFKKENIKSGDYVLDPFLGSGSTLIAAKECGINGYGYEINPFVADLANIKLNNYSLGDISLLKEIINKITSERFDSKNLAIPKLSIFNKLFQLETGEYLLSLIQDACGYKNLKISKLYKIAVLSIAEKLSNYRKAGNGLKIKRSKKFVSANRNDAKKAILSKLDTILNDLTYANKQKSKTVQAIFTKSSLIGIEEIKDDTLAGSVFSPPYVNCFDYTEIYKIELWLGGYVNEYSELRPIRSGSVRSHLNAFPSGNRDILFENKYLSLLLAELSTRHLWSKKIPKMIEFYFDDINKLLVNLFAKLKKNGFCKIVVSNSAYGGLVIPTDLVLSSFAEQIGYKVEKIEVIRYIITSSQQYKQTNSDKKYLRESIIHLRK